MKATTTWGYLLNYLSNPALERNLGGSYNSWRISTWSPVRSKLQHSSYLKIKFAHVYQKNQQLSSSSVLILIQLQLQPLNLLAIHNWTLNTNWILVTWNCHRKRGTINPDILKQDWNLTLTRLWPLASLNVAITDRDYLIMTFSRKSKMAVMKNL